MRVLRKFAYALCAPGLLLAATAQAQVDAEPEADEGSADEAQGLDDLPDEEPEVEEAPPATSTPAPAAAAEPPIEPEEQPSEEVPSPDLASEEAPTGDESEAPSKEEAKKAEEPEADRPHHEGSFEFGSYGRINVASDLQGRVARDTDIVSFGTRYDLDNYVELEFRREDRIGDIKMKEVMTLALAGEFFHFDAAFEEDIAFRNLFVSVEDGLFEDGEIWVGQRMVRGDDIYLVNFWPMDNLNITGGGLKQRFGQSLEASLTLGQYRPKQSFYYQEDEFLPQVGFDPVSWPTLNRPRTVVAGRLVGQKMNDQGAGGKVVLYGEHHSVSAGTRVEDTDILTQLPKDSGLVLGAQVGLWKGERQGFVNLFSRCAFDLAVYDPLFSPFRIGTPTDTDGARDCTLGLSSNLETSFMGLQTGGYIRHFQDQESDLEDGGQMFEGIFDVRPYFWIGENAGVQLDLSYQRQAKNETDPSGRQVGGSLGKFALMPFFSPWGRGTYTRPYLSVTYAVTLRDDGARRLYPDEHPYANRTASHYLGIGAEWWFNSTSY